MFDPEKNEELRMIADLYRSFHCIETFAGNSVLGLSEMMILIWLMSEQSGTAGKISKNLALTPSKTTRCIKSLANLYLIEESLDIKDLRKCRFELSKKGHNVLFEMTKTIKEENLVQWLNCYRALASARQSTVLPASCMRLTETVQRLLIVLYSNQGSMTVGDLCEVTSLSQSRVSMTLKNMQCHDLISIEHGKSDRRTREIGLGCAGHSCARDLTMKLQNILETTKPKKDKAN